MAHPSAAALGGAGGVCGRGVLGGVGVDEEAVFEVSLDGDPKCL